MKFGSQRGTYHVLMTLLMVPLISVIALASDGFLLMTYNVQQDSNAEYAALSAIKEFRFRNTAAYNTRVNLATASAGKVAGSNYYVGTKSVSQLPGGLFNPAYGEIAFGHIVGTSFVPAADETEFNNPIYASNWQAVRVILRTNNTTSMKTSFGNFLKTKQVNSTSTAVAYYDPDSGLYGILRR